jgi:hypothetical protein
MQEPKNYILPTSMEETAALFGWNASSFESMEYGSHPPKEQWHYTEHKYAS